jgi:hypothetical protein
MENRILDIPGCTNTSMQKITGAEHLANSTVDGFSVSSSCMLTTCSECKTSVYKITLEEWSFVSGGCISVIVILFFCASCCLQKR